MQTSAICGYICKNSKTENKPLKTITTFLTLLFFLRIPPPPQPCRKETLRQALKESGRHGLGTWCNTGYAFSST